MLGTQSHTTTDLQKYMASKLKKQPSKTCKKLEEISREEQLKEMEKHFHFGPVYFAFFCVYSGRTLSLPLLTYYGQELYAKDHNDPNAVMPDAVQV